MSTLGKVHDCAEIDRPLRLRHGGGALRTLGARRTRRRRRRWAPRRPHSRPQELQLVVLDVGPDMHPYLDEATRNLFNLATARVRR
jgi:hypothetical protein